MNNYKTDYLEIMNKMIKSGNELLYITIHPCKDISLNTLRFLVRKSIRDIGKSLNIPYPRFLSIFEISSDISKGNQVIKDLGLHSHMFMDVSLFDILTDKRNVVETQIFNTFQNNRVEVDIKIVEDIYDIQRLKGYHLKQSQYLTPGFLDTNYPEYNKKLDRVFKYLKNITYSKSIRKKIKKIEKKLSIDKV